MTKQHIIIFGASKRGQSAYDALKEQYDIKYFCDNDLKKQNTLFNGVPIIAPAELINHSDCAVVIASIFEDEIIEQLQNLGVCEYKQFIPASLTDNIKCDLEVINIGRLFQNCQTPIQLCDLTFLMGGSGMLDYLFIATIMEKVGVKKYLEIGTYFGESLSIASKIAEKCYSITLPPEQFEYYTKHFIGKNIASTCFPVNKDNITIFYEDSKEFDFTKIGLKMDLIFIDGDHSYEGILNDTKKCFEHLVDPDNTIVIWHDLKNFRSAHNLVLKQSLYAILDGTPEHFHHNIYRTDSNMCAIYIPNKHRHHFSTDSDDNAIYSYNVNIESVQKNKI